MKHQKARIVQIIPSTGWVAIYSGHEGFAPFDRLCDVACFALLDDGRVVPMVCDQKGYFHFVHDLPGLVNVHLPEKDA